jgi:hypothetical protein
MFDPFALHFCRANIRILGVFFANSNAVGGCIVKNIPTAVVVLLLPLLRCRFDAGWNLEPAK